MRVKSILFIGLALVMALGSVPPVFAEKAGVGLLVKYSATLPAIDGDPSDAEWAGAPKIDANGATLQAVYNGDEVAFLVSLDVETAIVHTPGNWVWDGSKWATWTDYRAAKGEESVKAAPMAAMLWDVGASTTAQNGACFMACHKVDAGSMKRQSPKGNPVDYWLLLRNFGYGIGALQGNGWPLGVDGAEQTSVAFYEGDNLAEPHQISAGKLTYYGYADERYLVPEKSGYVGESTVEYCSTCHSVEDVKSWSIQGDSGRLGYRRNGVDAPEYIKPAPANYVDATIITENDIASGKAVKVADLSAEQIAEIWKKYEALNACVPELILQKPEGGMADIPLAASWSNGKWTVEFKRKMVTGDPNDVQFDDTAKAYYALFQAGAWQKLESISPGPGFTVPIRVMFEAKPRGR